MIAIIGDVFVKTDKIADYVPGVSSITNFVGLFQKHAIQPCMGKNSVAKSHYYTHLQSKSSLRSILLLIPILGNILTAIYDVCIRKETKNHCSDAQQQACHKKVDLNKKQPHTSSDREVTDEGLQEPLTPTETESDAEILEHIIGQLKDGSLSLRDCFETIRTNREAVQVAISHNTTALKHADLALKKDRDFILSLIPNYPEVIRHADPSLKLDPNFLVSAVEINISILAYFLGAFPFDNEEVMLAVAKKNAFWFSYANEKLRADRDFMLKVVKENGRALEYAAAALKRDEDIVMTAVQDPKQTTSVLCYADDSLKGDRAIVLAAVKAYSANFYHADLTLRNDQEIREAANII